MNYKVQKNEQFNSSEIYFDSIPDKATRESLKSIGFRWHSIKKCWYGYKSEEQITAAINGNTVTDEMPVNEYGVKVGDVFSMSWGYDQTNNQFFQVVAVTRKKARIVEVQPQCIVDPSGPMSEHRTLAYKEGEMLPKISYKSIWIEDQENGDLKSIRDYSKAGDNPQVIIRSRGCYTARKCHPGETFYESWYA